jgi:hypothetical protein
MTYLEIQTAIMSGSVDADLAKIKLDIDARLASVRQSKTTKDFGIGDKVRFNETTGTAYVRGLTAVVVGIRQKKIVVRLDKPVGRFLKYDSQGNQVSSDIVVPTAIVDHI